MNAKIQRRALKLGLRRAEPWFVKVQKAANKIYNELKNRWKVLEDGTARELALSLLMLSPAVRGKDTRLTLAALQRHLDMRGSSGNDSTVKYIASGVIVRILAESNTFPNTTLLCNTSDTR